MREAVNILHDNPEDLHLVIGKNWITRFLNRHPQVMAKFSSACDKNRIKGRDPEIIIAHFRKVEKLIRTWDIAEDMIFNMDEKGLMMSESDRCKVICGWRGRGMTAKLAEDGNQELITVLEAI